MPRRRFTALALAAAWLVPLAPVGAAATPQVGVGISMGQYLPAWVGNQDGWSASITNTGTGGDEIITVALTTFDTASQMIPGRVLSPVRFVLPQGATCLEGIRWTVSSAMAANPGRYKARVSVTASLVKYPAGSGTSVNISAGVGAGIKLVPSSDVSGRLGNAILSKTQAMCGTGEAFTPPLQTVSGNNDLPTIAKNRTLLATAGRTNAALTVKPLGASFASDGWGMPLVGSTQVPAKMVYKGGGANGWKLPATGSCLIPATISGVVNGQTTGTVWDASVPLGRTGGVVHGYWRDVVKGFVYAAGSPYQDNGGFIVGQPFPQCMPAG